VTVSDGINLLSTRLGKRCTGNLGLREAKRTIRQRTYVCSSVGRGSRVSERQAAALCYRRQAPDFDNPCLAISGLKYRGFNSLHPDYSTPFLADRCRCLRFRLLISRGQTRTTTNQPDWAIQFTFSKKPYKLFLPLPNQVYWTLMVLVILLSGRMADGRSNLVKVSRRYHQHPSEVT